MTFICLQAGHEGTTTGATGAPGEQELNNRIRARLSQLLIERKFMVQLVNANPSDAEINKDFDLFLALHGDANIYGTGGGVICAPDPAYDMVNTESKRISKAIEEEYFKHSEIVNHPERINKNMTMYYMWSRLSAKTPCVILEMGVVQDPHDKVLLADTERIASAICRGICKAFNVPFDLVVVDPCATQNKKIDDLTKQITDLQAKDREKDNKILNLEKDLVEWNVTKKAYGITNFVELDAKFSAIQTGNLDNYVLKTKYNEDLDSVKEKTIESEGKKCTLKINQTKKELLAKLPKLIKLIYQLK